MRALLLSSFILCVISSCTTRKIVSLSPTSTFTRADGLVISEFEFDRFGFKQELAKTLTQRKFRVYSDTNFKRQITIEETISKQENGRSITSTISDQPNIAGKYLLITNFNARRNGFGVLIDNFSASITNVENGEIIMNSRIAEQMSMGRMADQFVQLLMEEMYALQESRKAQP